MLAIGNVPGSVNSMNTHQTHQQANAQWQPVMNNPAVHIQRYNLYQENRCLQTILLYQCNTTWYHQYI